MDLDELARDIATHNTEVKSRLDATGASIAEIKPAVDGLQAQVRDIEQKMSRRPGAGAGSVERKSLGQGVVNSEEYKSFMTGGGKGRLRIELKDVSNITSATASGGGLVAPDRQAPVGLPVRRFTVRSLLQAGETTSNLIQVPVQTSRNLNAAVVVGEGTLKPQSDMAFTLKDFPVATIAHWTRASRQILADAPVLQATIDTDLRYGLAFAEDAELLFGTGQNGNLAGLVPQASPFVEAFAPAMETRIDRLRLAMLQVRQALYPATGFVLNPADWAEIQLTKDSQGRYIFGDPQQGGDPKMWGLPVAESDSMPAGSFLTGAFGLAAQIFDRTEADVVISTEDQDNFVKNLVTILAEERLALVVRRPAALVYGTLVAGATPGAVAA